MRKLVELDLKTGRFLEIDTKRLRREAQALKDYILSSPSDNDKLNYRGNVLPIVEAALNGTLELPYRGYEPYNWEIREGLLPREFSKLYASFMNTAIGERMTIEIEIVDGKRHAWMEFED